MPCPGSNILLREYWCSVECMWKKKKRGGNRGLTVLELWVSKFLHLMLFFHSYLWGSWCLNTMFWIIFSLNITVWEINLQINIKTVKMIQAVTVCVYLNFVMSFTSDAWIKKWHYYSYNQLAKKTPNNLKNKGNITPPENPYKYGSLREIKSLNQT